jgi:outer membrane protein assembly factor BamB
MPRLSVLLFLLAIAAPVGAQGNWPSFRGPTGDGQAPTAHGLPVAWSESQNIVWKTAIHDKGWSSPVVWGRQIWLTTALENGKELYAVCIDGDTGKILHDVKLFDVAKPAFCHPVNSYASPTPVIEEGRVYVHFGSAGTACLDTATGKVLWTRRDLVCDHWRGPASSPILYKTLLILTFDGHDLQYLAALDKKTGETVWKKDKKIAFPDKDGDLKKAYSTPQVVELRGKPQLVSPSAEATIAVNPDTGDELWRVTHGGMNGSARPLFGHDHFFLTSGHTSKLLAVQVEESGNEQKAKVDWTCSQGVPSKSSLLLHDDLIFMVNDGGIASCVDVKTGKQIKQLRLGTSFAASPVLADGKIYFCGEKDGKSYVVEANRELKLLAANHLDEGCMASPAVIGKTIFLRTRTHLYRIEQK